MKFAKELEDDLVPEWRAKYINYKLGKQKIKAISRSLRNVNKTPRLAGRPPLSYTNSAASIPYTHYDFNARSDRRAKYGQTQPPPGGVDGNAGLEPTPGHQERNLRRMSTTMFSRSPPIQDPVDKPESSSYGEEESPESEGELTPLNRDRSGGPIEETAPVSYGSFSPPSQDTSRTVQPGQMPRLSLPDPALDPGRERAQSPDLAPLQDQQSASQRPERVVRLQEAEKKSETQNGHAPTLMKQRALRKVGRQKDQTDATPSNKLGTRDKWRKVFKAKQINSPEVSSFRQNAYNELDARQDDFFSFLDKELDKVEKFYKQKEDEAQDRLNVLRAQLHEHRDQRAREMKAHPQDQPHLATGEGTANQTRAESPFPNMPGKALDKATQNGHRFHQVFSHEAKIGKTSRAMNNLASPRLSPQTKANNGKKDYTRKQPTPRNEHVPHKFAKRRLKLALQEFYRGMELLKSYALLNRTGFRKINKKYDKAVNARPPLRYLNEKVSKAHFVKSTLIEEYLVAVEDLYARYFERGNHKLAVSRLRSKLRSGDHSGSTFRNGLWLAGGAGLGVSGLYNAAKYLYGDHAATRTVTSYLLQIYAGYFLALLLFLIFVLDCRIWTKARINYIFVFEFDTRHVLDWRQLAELPCFFFFLNGLFVWLNFQFGEAHSMYRYWPIILIGITLTIMALPFKVLFYHARLWWGFSNFRLLFAGFYPVEFRDFFLGDMYTSETYAMSQIEVFFCIYRWNWDNPSRCNSNHSMFLGFFTTLPAIWRFLQCVRRYKDSGNWFPHLANCAKYTGNIVYYMSLSLYRLHVNTDQARTYRIVFIFFAALNALYSSFWDVFMDWSLGQWHARKHPFLRDYLTYRRPWVYWLAIIFNVVFRNQWILYAVFTEDLQHSSAVSFFVALAEVLRRGVWTLFRVENEHTNNVKSFRASRDIPLPYSLPVSPEVGTTQESDELRRRRKAMSGDRAQAGRESTTAVTTGADHDLERQTTAESSDSVLRRRLSNTPALRALQLVGTVMAAAHSQDFQKKKRPDVVGHSPDDEAMLKSQGESSDEDEGDEIDGSVMGEEDSNDQDQERRQRSRTSTAGGAEQDYDDGGEAGPSSSHAHEPAGNLEPSNKEMVDEARRLALEFNSGVGENSKKKNS